MKQTKTQILEIIKDDTKGSDPLDKLRLFIIWFLSTEQEVSRADWTQFEEALTARGVDCTSLPYVRQVRATTKMTQLTTINNPSSQQAAQSSDLFGRFSSLSTRLTDRLKDTGVGVPGNLASNFDSLIGGIKNFLPANRDLTVTKIVESIMDPQTASSSAIAKTETTSTSTRAVPMLAARCLQLVKCAQGIPVVAACPEVWVRQRQVPVPALGRGGRATQMRSSLLLEAAAWTNMVTCRSGFNAQERARLPRSVLCTAAPNCSTRASSSQKSWKSLVVRLAVRLVPALRNLQRAITLQLSNNPSWKQHILDVFVKPQHLLCAGPE